MANRALHLVRKAAGTPEAIALIVDGTSISFAELGNRAGKAAGAFRALGIGKGDHVGIWLPSGLDFIVVEQALFWLGAVVTPINLLYRPGEVRQAASSCALRSIVTTAERASTFDGEPPCPLILTDAAIAQGDARSLSDIMAATTPLTDLVDVRDQDLAMLLLTSATTGKAKGVMLTAGNLAANYDRTPGWLGIDQHGVILCALPLYNTFGLNQGINAMVATGCTMVLLPRFDAGLCIAAIAHHRCTFLPAVPTMLQKILDHPSATADALASLRTIMTGGAPVPSALLRRLLDLVPDVELLTGYGLTEATALVTLAQVRPIADGRADRERSIGRVLDGIDLAIVDDAGHAQPAGTIGEIVVRGPNVMAGYFNAPADSAAALGSGWLRTGDIGYLDDAGYAYIVDRKKDVIIRGGQNIYPADIEEVLYEVPSVAEVAVVARPDALLGEVPIAYVALRPRATASAQQMLDHCRAALAPYKWPAAIEIRDALPKGPTGKILRRALRAAPQAA